MVCLYEIICRVGLPCTAIWHGTLLRRLIFMSTMTYVSSHVNFYGQTETCYGEQADGDNGSRDGYRVHDVCFFFLFAMMLRFIWVNPLGLHYKEK